MSLGRMSMGCKATTGSLVSMAKAAEVARDEIAKTTKMSEGLRKLHEAAEPYGSQAASGSSQGSGGFLTPKGAIDLVDAYVKGLKFLDRRDFEATLYGPQVKQGLQQLEHEFELMYAQFGDLKKLGQEQYRIETEANRSDATRSKALSADVEKVVQVLKSLHSMVAALPTYAQVEATVKQVVTNVATAAPGARDWWRSHSAPTLSPSQRVAPPPPPVQPPPRGGNNPTGTLPK